MEKEMGKNKVNENLDTAFSYLEKFLRTETVVGEAIVIGETTIIPLVTVSFGAGGGGGKGPVNNESSGLGVGMGAKITTDAVLVVKDGIVSIIPVKGRTDIDRLVGMVPELIEKFVPKKKVETETIG